MAQIRSFAGIHYARRTTLDLSKLIAPPYDVLGEQDRQVLRQRDPHNIVHIDLPHFPARSAGPDSAYQEADLRLQSWLGSDVLQRDQRPAIYLYTQSFDHGGRTVHRRGLIALVKLSPFGAGEVVPHELTHKGPIEDRLKLMRATGVQLSPIFGLFSDPRNEITNLLYRQAGRPMLSATLDEVKNDLWAMTDAEVQNQVTDLMKARAIYIADGHHRYTTALQYQAEITRAGGGSLPPNHPANWCMFVLVSMQDPGLLILPTHRLVGGLDGYSAAALGKAVAAHFDLVQSPDGPEQIESFTQRLAAAPPHTFGLFDGATRKLYELRPKNPDLLATLEPGRTEAWRRLDVAILQRYLIDEVLKPRFAGGKEPILGYTADANSITPQVDGRQYQLALLLRPTSLHALEQLGKSGEVMPQKSTYFYPKLVTGMVINPLR